MDKEFYEKATIEDGVLLHYNLSDESHITIPEGITRIAKDAFQDSYKLDTVTLPNSVSVIEPNAFNNCCSIEEFIISPEHPHFTFDGDALLSKDKTILVWVMPVLGDHYEIPDTVTTIAESAFDFCDITSVTIPGNVKVIGKNAFDCCELETVTIMNGVTTIEQNAFGNCSDLTEMVIPDSVTTIGWGAFSLCHGLTAVVLPRGLTTIEGSTFMFCHSLTTINIPEGVTHIGNSAFYGCKSLTDIVIPDTVTSIGDHVFEDCSDLDTIAIPKSVTSLGKWKGSKKPTICAFPTSAAWKWAEENGLPTKAPNPQPGCCPRCGSKLKGLFFKKCPQCK